jgi:integrase
VSGHIQDLWYSPGPRGAKPRPTSRHGHGQRWKARYLDPDNKERSKSFARKADAERFLTEVEHSKIAGSYLDPDAGRVTLKSRVPLWLDSLTCDPTTRHQISGRVAKHILGSPLADKRLDVLSRSPSAIQGWLAGLPVGASYAQQILSDLSSIFDAAVADSLIPRNPCKAGTVRAPRVVKRQLVPWTREQVAAVRAVLPERYRAMADCGAGLGLRQGEIFGLALSEIDWLRKVVHIRLQVRLDLGSVPVFAPPKRGKTRQVPLPGPVALVLASHLEKFPARPVTLPQLTRTGKARTEELIFTAVRGGAVSKAVFNAKAWTPARRAAGIPDGRDSGMHQLRHHYASVLLRGGVDIKRVSAYLGHHSAAFTLSVYTHLMPDDEERSLREIETALTGPSVASTDTLGVSWKA